LILNGVEAKYGSAPWNVGVYQKSTNNSFSMICGGSLISTNLVVSGKKLCAVYWYLAQNDKQFIFSCSLLLGRKVID